MDTVPVLPWVQSDTLRKSQTAGSAVDAAASDGTAADDVEVTAASASSTPFQKGREIWHMQDMASTQNNQNEAKLLFSWPLSSPLLTTEFKFNSLTATID